MEKERLFVPLQVLGITKFSGSDLVLNAKDDAEDEADGTNDDVGVAEEGVTTTDPCGGGEHDVLLS
jgi:hypothetical protein